MPSELSNPLSCFIFFIALAINSVIFQLIYLVYFLFTQLECKFHEDRHLVGSYSLLHPHHQDQWLAHSRGIIFVGLMSE